MFKIHIITKKKSHFLLTHHKDKINIQTIKRKKLKHVKHKEIIFYSHIILLMISWKELIMVLALIKLSYPHNHINPANKLLMFILNVHLLLITNFNQSKTIKFIQLNFKTKILIKYLLIKTNQIYSLKFSHKCKPKKYKFLTKNLKLMKYAD